MIKLAIFDVDGTLVDSESVYLKAAIKNIKTHNYPVKMETIYKTFGATQAAIRKLISDDLGGDDKYDAYLSNLRKLMDDIYEKEPVKVKEGTFEILEYLKENNVKIAIATSTYRDKQMPVLEKTGLLKYIDSMVFGDEIKNSKPAPDIYLKAMEYYNFQKEEALIFEDSINGILSGYNAGIKVIGIPDQVAIPKDVQDKTYAMCNNLIEAIDITKKLL